MLVKLVSHGSNGGNHCRDHGGVIYAALRKQQEIIVGGLEVFLGAVGELQNAGDILKGLEKLRPRVSLGRKQLVGGVEGLSLEFLEAAVP
ncbi:hypothetical protein CIP107510_02100 [Corynebacterium diphtheriae]|nr:hypothetical protein CIP107507_01979 [Corynebacterium diphtheriae]CAB0570247.1 hypothetical protein CIP107510_02100 [Corynebacterium diphtheriae]CAB0621765.1 hypothetical protein CIP107557_02186 [Corynebacterium diphtheriae]CAB0664899.1 hypothetical protein CIP107573_02040 [Corynebacterium diphtheriae]CAB0708173.1 hypothetical protein FRC0082_01881 [Corynebacterium diphtheriae]